ncbi:hypothetical protein [Mycolicibacterium gadium]|uniref:hypothetical protein n=1 Tax=Mycolicibacterium gadium TaxID=1794 RepID=UPI002FDE50CA
MSVLELLAATDDRVRSDGIAVRWPIPGAETADLVTDIDWSISTFGSTTVVARDLSRIASAAYLIDRSVRRSQNYFSRHLEIVVHLDDPGTFLGPAAQRLVDLFAWLTGDAWTLTPVANHVQTNFASETITGRDAVALLSGGLDSLCGAVLAPAELHATSLYVGHRDQTRAVARSQDAIAGALTRSTAGFLWKHVRLAPADSRENSTRTRSFLFMALAIAAAAAISATEVRVPENGFTSVNPAMVPSRGGALSTKSTHPWTFDQANLLLSELGVPVTLVNPHARETKGEMLASAVAKFGDPVLEIAAQTLSCSKLDGGLGYEGGSPNVNCGLCIACLIRRGAFIGAGVDDPTEYLQDRVTAKGRAKLLKARHWDLWAVQSWATRTPTMDDLIASARWPRGTDYEAMLDVVVRGRHELLEAIDHAL